MEKIKIGISSCLLGNNVRYNGGHTLDRYLVNTLGQYVDYVPVCPEVETGFPIPRPSFRLVGEVKSPRLVVEKTGEDVTERMQGWAKGRLQQLRKDDLCGFIFQSRSPSSGMERVKVYDKHGMPHKQGVGIWARAFMDAFPFMPVEEDGRMHDPKLRENFIVRIFTYHRWKQAIQKERTIKTVVNFHAQNKLLLMAHHVEGLRQLGRHVANPKAYSLDEFIRKYEEQLMTLLKRKATVKKHTNVLQHIKGYFKSQLSHDEKQEFQELIDRFHGGLVPLIVPITLIQHYVRKYQPHYLKDQYYLQPHPVELKLRNHA